MQGFLYQNDVYIMAPDFSGLITIGVVILVLGLLFGLAVAFLSKISWLISVALVLALAIAVTAFLRSPN